MARKGLFRIRKRKNSNNSNRKIRKQDGKCRFYYILDVNVHHSTSEIKSKVVRYCWYIKESILHRNLFAWVRGSCFGLIMANILHKNPYFIATNCTCKEMITSYSQEVVNCTEFPIFGKFSIPVLKVQNFAGHPLSHML